MKTLPAPSRLSKDERKLICARMRLLVNAVFREEQSAVAKLQSMAKRYPDLFAMEVNGDIRRFAQTALVNHECATNEKLKCDVLARMEVIAADLAGDNPSVARQMCADVAAFCWADAWTVSMNVGGNGVQQTSPVATRRLSAAQSRLLRSLKTLSQIEAVENRRPRRAQQTIDVEFRER
jgi:hypothetical protein